MDTLNQLFAISLFDLKTILHGSKLTILLYENANKYKTNGKMTYVNMKIEFQHLWRVLPPGRDGLYEKGSKSNCST